MSGGPNENQSLSYAERLAQNNPSTTDAGTPTGGGGQADNSGVPERIPYQPTQRQLGYGYGGQAPMFARSAGIGALGYPQYQGGYYSNAYSSPYSSAYNSPYGGGQGPFSRSYYPTQASFNSPYSNRFGGYGQQPSMYSSSYGSRKGGGGYGSQGSPLYGQPSFQPSYNMPSNPFYQTPAPQPAPTQSSGKGGGYPAQTQQTGKGGSYPSSGDIRSQTTGGSFGR